jgi:hypothetical protein
MSDAIVLVFSKIKAVSGGHSWGSSLHPLAIGSALFLLGYASGCFPRGFQTKILYVLVPYHGRRSFLYSITLRLPNEMYKSRSPVNRPRNSNLLLPTQFVWDSRIIRQSVTLKTHLLSKCCVHNKIASRIFVKTQHAHMLSTEDRSSLFCLL